MGIRDLFFAVEMGNWDEVEEEEEKEFLAKLIEVIDYSCNLFFSGF